MGHSVWQLLQLEGLEVHALALVRHYEIWVQWALGAPSLIPVWESKGSQSYPENPKDGGSSRSQQPDMFISNLRWSWDKLAPKGGQLLC
jgi:hypothetical protein